MTVSLLVALGLGAAPASFATPPAGDVALAGLLGSRPGATALPVQISDQVGGSIDVGTGNFLLSINALTLPGINSNQGLGATFNSLSTITAPGLVAPRWTMALGSAGSLATASTGMIFTAGDGYAALFTAVSGSPTAYTPPVGVKADLVKTGATGWTLTSRTSAQIITFDSDGRATKIADRNANNTTLIWSSNKPTQIVSTRGITAVRTATIAYDSGGLLASYSQTSGGATRTASFARDTNGNLTGFTDRAGMSTTFAYTGGRVSTITTAAGAITKLSYDSSGRVTKMEKTNTTAGSPGSSITRLTYPTATQTLVAGPNTDQAVAVATGPRTTYTLTTTKRVSAVTDSMGRAQAKTYTADFDTLTATQGTGTTAGTTTNTFGANTGQSLTQSQSPGGSKTQLAYTNTAASTKYLPTSTTSDAGDQSLFTYNGAGNALTSSDALAATATLSYNTDGTVATALAPGNGTNKTVYGYNTNHELTTITPVTGTSLTSTSMSYDSWGRTQTVTSAPGITATYSYDSIGRLTQTTFSDSTPTITYTYNDDGQLITRVDGSGTTTYGYDQMGRLITRANTAGCGTITYGYDKASNLTSTTDTHGTTNYTYDTAGTPTTLIYLLNGVAKTLAFATDNQGRSTDTWLEANPTRTTWKARTHTDYDTTGRVSRVTAAQGTGDTSNTPVMDLSYCYVAGTTAPNCTSTAANDRKNIQWVKNNLTGDVTTYSYDGANRLTKAVIAGGTTPAITYNYSYDVRGNRLTATTTGAATTSQTFTANAANQITNTGYTFDGSGNLTADPAGSYSYNAAQQMTSVTKAGTTYTRSYAGSGQNELLVQQNPGANFEFTYGRSDANGQPTIEQIKRNNSTAYIEHDPVTGEPLMLRTSSGMQSLYIFDGTGNPAALVTSDAYEAFAYNYDPFGVPTLTTDSGGNGQPQNPYLFKQGTQDRTTGWLKYGARYYNPTTGRWTQQDTLDTPLNPANANRYAYAANNPINFSDPTGNITGECFGALVGFVSAFGLFAVSAVGATVGTAAAPPVGAIGWWAAGFSFGVAIGAGTAANSDCSS
ncbi:RHS repeat-associated core domain-containing protein [Arthrobacter psychrolactophilus]|uniref:RHS repeat-associated core domain-containing protein n=1 Tax=Arthrobacter psychrolactophilus TaxID=92442 RepID=UPI0015E8A0AE|nr:RHS repeat-associated core domain-containing protein [Arthrobacter psychrolactophilus]